MQVEELKTAVVNALEEIKARDIVVLDVRKLTSLCDYMIVASADSARQTKALARNVHDKIKAGGGSVIGIEGEQTGEWVLVDVGDIVVHIMQPAIREYYNRRAQEFEFSWLTFCLLGVATPSDLIRNTRLTPFNVGHRIELNDFTPAEAAPLCTRRGWW